ncbi:hypothetical protein WJX84_007323 [Apatococcus fuscideae]|uniref:Uncharacterized protein n=1 Tax=Apatococcus fuscideae TaxID=2026836 RepID=A0AAW1TM93_9CHLO
MPRSKTHTGNGTSPVSFERSGQTDRDDIEQESPLTGCLQDLKTHTRSSSARLSLTPRLCHDSTQKANNLV